MREDTKLHLKPVPTTDIGLERIVSLLADVSAQADLLVIRMPNRSTVERTLFQYVSFEF